MKKEFKIVICGGGSTYTAGIVKNLLEEEELKIKELWLYDIDQERQEKVSLIVKEVVKDLRPSLELKISTDEEEAFRCRLYYGTDASRWTKNASKR